MRISRWAVLVGVTLMLISGGTLVTVDTVLARYEGAVGHADLFGDGEAAKPSAVKGPLNILLAGIDPRDENEIPRSDSILVMHVSQNLDQGYLFSLPRDLVVPIPAFPKSGYAGSGAEKLTHAMFFGAQIPGQTRPNVPQGFDLLARTVLGVTGVQRFDAGAIIDFGGFQRLIDELGGVDMFVDQQVKSLHLRPDGSGRTPASVGYSGPQMIYEPGMHHFVGWQALDYSRQRYIEGGDYARQRHQQQLVRALIAKAFSSDVISSPATVDRVLRAAGKSLTFSGRGVSLFDWGLALRGLRPENVVTIQLSGGALNDLQGQYQGEQLDEVSRGFLAAVADNSVDSYVIQHPEMINPTG